MARDRRQSHEESAPIGAAGHGEPWSHSSLFSSGPSSPPEPHSAVPDTRAHATAFSISGSSRPLTSLAALAGMTKRTARLHVSDEPHASNSLIHAQMAQAQKSGDDPTTAENRSSRKRTTLDLMRVEHTTRNNLRGLFSDSAVPGSGSRSTSYSGPIGPSLMRSPNEAIPLPDHLFTRGLLEGRHSDIAVVAFGQRYNLHRLILDRAPFFATALSEPWLESQAKEVTLHPEEVDQNITQTAFELAIRRLYGVDISAEAEAEAVGLFATARWLEMQDLVDSAIELILHQMVPENLAYIVRLVTSNYYGKSGDLILESAKAMLSRNGWEMSLKYWDDMPGDIVRELVGSDGFYVNSEWDRWVLAKRLLDRRLRQTAVEAGLAQRGQKPFPQAPDSLRLMAIRFDGVYRRNAQSAAGQQDSRNQWIALYTTPDIERILVLLDEGIHYIHMDYEQLQYIRKARDALGLPVMPDKVISDAMWRQLELRQMVLNADESSQELGLSHDAPEPERVLETVTSASTETIKGKSKAVNDNPPDDELDSDSWDGNGKPRKFWIPSSDCNIVLGNGNDPVVTTSNTFQRHATRLSASIMPEDAHWATDFASTPSNIINSGARTERAHRPVSAGGSNAGQPKPISYTEFPPFRFSAEFSNPRFLKEKKRVYSRTVSYAGSLWNIYIQKVRSAKSVQLGVYLHRAKERDVDDAALASGLSQQGNGSVDERIGQLEHDLLLRSQRRDRFHRARLAINDQTVEEDTSGSGMDDEAHMLLSNGRTPLFAGSGSLTRRRLDNHAAIPFALQTLTGSPPLPHDSNPIDSPAFPSALYSPSSASAASSDSEDPYPNPSLPRPTHAAPPTTANPPISTSTSATAPTPTPTTPHPRAPHKPRPTHPALPAYVDARPTIKTYFKIYSPSKGGRMLSIYESAPDRFNFSQSWGWKSSTLMLDDGEGGAGGGSGGGGKDGGDGGVGLGSGSLGGGAAGGLGKGGGRGEGKLRFVVVIGNL